MTLYLTAAEKEWKEYVTDYNINNSSINLSYIITKIPITLSFYLILIHLIYLASDIRKYNYDKAA